MEDLGGEKVSRADVLAHLWEQGLIWPWLLREHQKDLFLRQAAMKPLDVLVEVCARRFGKTTETLILAETIARNQPGSIIRYAAPTESMAKTVVLPAWHKILATCPKHLLPMDRTQTERCYRWPNGSRLYLAGTDLDPDRLRGSEAHLVIVDEAGFHKKLKYVVEDILSPQLNDTDGIMIICSTPPDSMDHEFMSYWRAAKKGDFLITKTLLDNTFYSRAKKLKICEGKNPGMTPEEIELIFDRKMEGSPTWEREYMCEMVTDKTRRVAPDFSQIAHVGRQNIRAPAYETNYVFIDQADGTDFFAAVFATYNFAAKKLFVRAEWMSKKKNSSQIVIELRQIERDLWGSAKVQRYSDDPRGGSQRRDMADLYHYPIQTARKSTGARDMMDTLSVHLKADKIVVDPGCVKLIDQMKDGVWAVSKTGKADFERSEMLGHCDALNALGMGVRCVAWHKNPAGGSDWVDPNVFYAAEPKAEVSASFQKSIRTLGRAFGHVGRN